jgi:hypothetical protein
MKARLVCILAYLVLACRAMAQNSPATNTTAFALVKLGDKFIAAQARDKITAIYSEKSSGRLAPGTWFVDYYDSTTAFKVTEVKFAGGKVVEIKQPKRVLDSFVGAKQLEWRKTKIDSDRALAIALKEPALAKVDLRATQYWLQRTPVGSTWKIRFWIARLGRPDETTEVGDLYISSKNGEILKNDLHF